MLAFKKHISIIVIVLNLVLPTFALAQITLNLDYPEVGGLKLNRDQDLNEILAWFYYFIIGISGIAAFTMLVWAGFLWLTSTGDTGKITEAKDRITSAVLGLVLILSSYLILQTINPELTILQLPDLAIMSQ